MKNARLKHILAILLLVVLTACVMLFVVRSERTFQAPDALSVTSAVVTETAQTEEAATTAVEETTEETTEWLPPIVYDPYTPSEIDTQSFVDTVVVGNSQAQALKLYGLLKNADFCTRIGLSVNQVLRSNSGAPPINDLNGKHYSKAVFVFGENELGWPDPANFIKYYKQVIAKVREMNPGVQVFVQAVFPVSAKTSETSKSGITNENVRIFNKYIEEMCDEIDAVFMPVSPAFFDETGALPADVAHDGVHFGIDYCKIWAGDLSAYLGSDVEETVNESIQEETTI